MMNSKTIECLLVTANCGSVFEDPSRLLENWIAEFLSHVKKSKPKFIGLHLQEVGGKTYEKSMEYVEQFIKYLCESIELSEFSKIRIYLDEDYNSAEHFTALGNLYFAHNSIKSLKIWNFLNHEYEDAEGKTIQTGNIESVATKEKAKFPQQFFPECKWSRKGFLRTRWNIDGSTIDLINIHLFHDASNLAACEPFPSVYCKSRRRALIHTLERIHNDQQNGLVPFFIFGDFNFRCDTEGVVRKLTTHLTEQRIPHLKSDHSKIQFRDADGSVQLTVGKKEFTHIDHKIFKEDWLKKFDRELEPLEDILHEFPINFSPTYPFEENPQLPHHYMTTRCPSWCDRILMTKSMKRLIENEENVEYGIVGKEICMGDHKPVFLKLSLKTNQDAVSENEIWKAKIDLQIFQTLMLECDSKNYSELDSSKCVKRYIKIIPSSTHGEETIKDDKLTSSIDEEESNESIIENYYLETTV
ncbi:inositol polyphosphate-5-phosphatase A isoform X2 [Chironomus tepperi]|uniref:inositol polyphosphate-5-phosphatase A isoform X2 n=1 Tax=Chironomus tepperi TaxID=113505 RepID=UPI00391EEC3F